MFKLKKYNYIIIKLIAIFLLAIILFMYPIQSIASSQLTIKTLGSGNTLSSGENSLWSYPFAEEKIITSPFGYREYPDPGHHNGIDFAATQGTPILAPASGIVLKSEFHNHQKGWGNYLSVQTDDGYVWIIAHLNELSYLKPGDRVERGQFVGNVGDSGYSFGFHLHLEIRKNNKPINPATLIDMSTPGVPSGITSLSGQNSLRLKDYKQMIQDGEFFYKGLSEGHYVMSQFNFWKWIVNALFQITDYLIGMTTYLVRLGMLGWGMLFEVVLTDAFDSLVVKNKGSGSYRKNNLGFYTDSKRTVNVENIFFNRVEVLNVNFFESKEAVKERLLKYSPTGLEVDELYGSKNTNIDINIDDLEDGPLLIVKDYFSQIFILFYVLALILLLVAFIINAVMASVESIGSKKATYKKRAKDWLKALIEVFLVLLYMIFILNLHTWLVNLMSKLSDEAIEKMATNYVQTDMGKNYTIMETLRTRAYDLKLTVGLPAVIMYLVLIWYTIKFLLIYVKRFLVVFFLSLLGPTLMVYDLIMKTIKGKSEVRTSWLKEYTFNVLIQVVHAFVYTIFIPLIYSLASTSFMGFILMFFLFRFLLDSERIIRNVFNISGAKTHSTLENVLEKSTVKDFVTGFALSEVLGKGSLTSKIATKALKPAKVVLGTAGSLTFTAGYNVVQMTKEGIRDRRIAKGKSPISERQKKKQEKIDQKVADILKLQGYSDEEIKERLSSTGKLALTEEQKDKIRLLDISKTIKRSIFLRGVDKTKYIGKRFKRILSNLGEVNEDNKKRIKIGSVIYDKEEGKIKLKDGLGRRVKEAVKKEYNMGYDEIGDAEYERTMVDLKKANLLGLRIVSSMFFYPIKLADPDLPEEFFLALRQNFQFNSKTLKPKKLKRTSTYTVGMNEQTGKIEYGKRKNRKIRKDKKRKLKINQAKYKIMQANRKYQAKNNKPIRTKKRNKKNNKNSSNKPTNP